MISIPPGLLFCPDHFDGIDVARAAHVAAEDEPFAIGREGDVWFERVIVFGEVHQFLGDEAPDFDGFAIDGARLIIGGGAEEVNPLAVGGRIEAFVFGQWSFVGHAVWATAIAGKEFAVG